MSVPGIAMNTGRMIPAISFGTGTSFFNRPDDVASHIHDAYQAGFRCFDTATIYSTETGLGRGIKELNVDRKDLFITTKTPDWAWDKESIEQSVRESLAKLEVDYLDLVLIHTPAPRYDMLKRLGLMTEDEIKKLPDCTSQEVMDNARLQAWLGLQQCVDKGLIRDIGVSNYTVSHLKNLLKHKEVTIVPAINQVEYNPYMVDKPLYDFCKEKTILVQAFAPLGNGKTLMEDPVMQRVAQKYNKTAAQVALRWALQIGVPTVNKTEKVHRMKENLDYFDFNISDQEMEEISALNKNERRFGDPARFP